MRKVFSFYNQFKRVLAIFSLFELRLRLLLYSGSLMDDSYSKDYNLVAEYCYVSEILLTVLFML